MANDHRETGSDTSGRAMLVWDTSLYGYLRVGSLKGSYHTNWGYIYQYFDHDGYAVPNTFIMGAWESNSSTNSNTANTHPDRGRYFKMQLLEYNRFSKTFSYKLGTSSRGKAYDMTNRDFVSTPSPIVVSRWWNGQGANDSRVILHNYNYPVQFSTADMGTSYLNLIDGRYGGHSEDVSYHGGSTGAHNWVVLDLGDTYGKDVITFS